MFNFLKKKKIVTRFAPSPTGFLHLGNYRTALFSYIFARQNNGKFLLRIEDTDKERSRKEYTDDILENLKWSKLNYDSISHQSKNQINHEKYLQKLVDSGKAYVSKETPKEVGDRTEVIRFKNPNKKITFTDLIRGEITIDTSDLKDFVIAKSLNEPLFHLAVVVDDFESGVTHIIRGEDHISNTPRQILIQEAIGAPRPIYAHLPLILAPDRTKLSKRNGGTSINEVKNQGYLPEALINFLALLGWNPGTDEEIFSLDELIQKFNISSIQKSGAIFNVERLDWINKKYLEKMSEKERVDYLKPHLPKELTEETKEKLIPVIFERIHKVADVEEMKKTGEFDYLIKKPEYKMEDLPWKNDDPETAKIHLEDAYNRLQSLKNSETSPATAKKGAGGPGEKR